MCSHSGRFHPLILCGLFLRIHVLGLPCAPALSAELLSSPPLVGTARLAMPWAALFALGAQPPSAAQPSGTHFIATACLAAGETLTDVLSRGFGCI